MLIHSLPRLGNNITAERRNKNNNLVQQNNHSGPFLYPLLKRRESFSSKIAVVKGYNNLALQVAACTQIFREENRKPIHIHNLERSAEETKVEG